MTIPYRVDPLQAGSPIVNREGAPTPLFLRQWGNLVRFRHAIQGAATPSGGTTGQVLTKRSAADFDTEWTDPGAPSAESVAFPFYDNAGALRKIALLTPGPLLPFFVSSGDSKDIPMIPA